MKCSQITGKNNEELHWPGEVHGLYGPWGCKALDTTEQLSLHFTSEQG